MSTSRENRRPRPELTPLEKALARMQRMWDSYKHASDYEPLADAREYQERRARVNNELALADAGIVVNQ